MLGAQSSLRHRIQEFPTDPDATCTRYVCQILGQQRILSAYEAIDGLSKHRVLQLGVLSETFTKRSHSKDHQLLTANTPD